MDMKQAFSGMYGITAACVLLSAIMHIPAALTGAGMPMFVAAVIYTVLAFGLLKRMRWVAWITFFFMLLGSIIAYAMTGPNAAAPNWILYAIFVFDLAAAVCLFVVLWRDKAPKPTAA